MLHLNTRKYSSFKSLFLILFFICSSCSDNRVLNLKKCKSDKQVMRCGEGCTITGTKYSNFIVKKNNVMFVSTNEEGSKDIKELTDCKVLDENNWKCDYVSMFDGIVTYTYGKFCAK